MKAEGELYGEGGKGPRTEGRQQCVWRESKYKDVYYKNNKMKPISLYVIRCGRRGASE